MSNQIRETNVPFIFNERIFLFPRTFFLQGFGFEVLYWALSRQRNDCCTGQSPGGGGWPNPSHALQEGAEVRLGTAGSRGMVARTSLRGGRQPSTLLWEGVSSHSRGGEGGIIQTFPTTNARQCATPSLLPHVLMLPMLKKGKCELTIGNCHCHCHGYGHCHCRYPCYFQCHWHCNCYSEHCGCDCDCVTTTVITIIMMVNGQCLCPTFSLLPTLNLSWLWSCFFSPPPVLS